MRKEREQAGLIQGGANTVVQVRQRIGATADTTTLFSEENKKELIGTPA